jgi:hypothetical protein
MEETNRTIGEVTQLVRLLGAGQEDVKGRLFELVYGELRCIAGARMKAERPGHTLTPTALVNEAYLRLNGTSDLRFTDRAHFLPFWLRRCDVCWWTTPEPAAQPNVTMRRYENSSG